MFMSATFMIDKKWKQKMPIKNSMNENDGMLIMLVMQWNNTQEGIKEKTAVNCHRIDESKESKTK